MESLGFSQFRQLLDLWDEEVQKSQENKEIEKIVDSNQFLLFFKSKGSIFGTGEDGRVTFARIKNPDDDTITGWDEEANFAATNLTKLVQGEQSSSVFSQKDLKDIKVLDKDKVIEELSKAKSDKEIADTDSENDDDNAHHPDNFIQTLEQ